MEGDDGKAIAQLNSYFVKGMSIFFLLMNKKVNGKCLACLRCGKVSLPVDGLEPYLLHFLLKTHVLRM
jgi:hypothetical protein